VSKFFLDIDLSVHFTPLQSRCRGGAICRHPIWCFADHNVPIKYDWCPIRVLACDRMSSANQRPADSTAWQAWRWVSLNGRRWVTLNVVSGMTSSRNAGWRFQLPQNQFLRRGDTCSWSARNPMVAQGHVCHLPSWDWPGGGFSSLPTPG